MATQALEQSKGLGRHGEAPRATAGPVRHGPHQRRAGALPGEPTDDLDPPPGLAEGALDEVEVADASPVLGREPQVHRQSGEVVGRPPLRGNGRSTWPQTPRPGGEPRPGPRRRARRHRRRIRALRGQVGRTNGGDAASASSCGGWYPTGTRLTRTFTLVGKERRDPVDGWPSSLGALLPTPPRRARIRPRSQP